MDAALPRADGVVIERPRDIPTLTGIRFVLAFWVVLMHVSHLAVPVQITSVRFPDFSYVPIACHGYLGVDVFFILSGFILSHVYAARFAAREAGLMRHFLWLRFARIWPAFAAVLFLTAGAKILLMLHGGGSSLSNVPNPWWRELLVHTFMLQSWGLADASSFNTPAWSVSAEWFAYTFFPAFLLITWQLRSVLSRTITLAMLLLALYLVYFLYIPPDPVSGPRPSIYSVGVGGMPRLVFEFLAGCILYTFMLPAAKPNRGAIGDRALLSGMAWALSVLLFLADVPYIEILALPGLALALWGASAEGPIARKLLAGPRMLFLGEASYAIYIAQALVVAVGYRMIEAWHLERQPWLMFAICVVAAVPVVLALGIALHLFVERPARLWLRRFG